MIVAQQERESSMGVLAISLLALAVILWTLTNEDDLNDDLD